MSHPQIHALPNMEVKDLCHLSRSRLRDQDKDNASVALVYVHGSWNPHFDQAFVHQRLSDLLLTTIKKGKNNSSPDAVYFTGALQVDQTEECMSQCLGDNGEHEEDMSENDFPCPPEHLPALAISVQTPASPHARIRYLTDISSAEIFSYFKSPTKSATKVETAWAPLLRSTIFRLIAQMNVFSRAQTNKRKRGNTPREDGGADDTAIRIFVAGDRSSVGKSSVCLGLLGTLVNNFGYDPSSLAYIKPATQSESPQLVQKYCDSVGIACEPVGPLVYYKGFTRAFLAGDTGQTTEDLLNDCGQAVDNIAQGKKVVLIDGVGFPAVGSICGTDNASVSRACGYPQSTGVRQPMGVIVVGGSGVGAAVDSFNLNATYFEMKQVPVMGGIFNKLSTEGFYSLENCRTQVIRYFQQDEYQQRLGRTPFGFVPKFPALSGDDAINYADEFFQVFSDHVDIQAILDSARRIKQDQNKTVIPSARDIDSPLNNGNTAAAAATKRTSNAVKDKENGNGNSSGRSKIPRLSRKDIEQLAKQQGAPPMA